MLVRQLLPGALRAARERQGLSVRACARDCGIGSSHLSAIERGLKRPGSDIVDRLCVRLGVKPDDVTYSVADPHCPACGHPLDLSPTAAA